MRHAPLWQAATSTHRRPFQWRGRFIGRHDITVKDKVDSVDNCFDPLGCVADLSTRIIRSPGVSCVDSFVRR